MFFASVTLSSAYQYPQILLFKGNPHSDKETCRLMHFPCLALSYRLSPLNEANPPALKPSHGCCSAQGTGCSILDCPQVPLPIFLVSKLSNIASLWCILNSCCALRPWGVLELLRLHWEAVCLLLVGNGSQFGNFVITILWLVLKGPQWGQVEKAWSRSLWG